MKIVLFFFTAIVLAANSYGITEYKPGDSLFVWAKSGLNMRNAPNVSGQILAKIPFGKEVSCKGRKSWFDYVKYSKTITDIVQDEEHGGVCQIEMKGQWVKISYDGIEGYIFDAYLSRFKPKSRGGDITRLFEYFKNRCDSVIYLERKVPNLEFGRDKVILCNGIFATQNYHSGGYNFQMSIPDCSIEEVFLILRYLEYELSGIIQKEDGGILIGQDLGGYTIESFKNFVIVTGEWTC